MRTSTPTYLAYVALAVAVCAWIAVGYFSWFIRSERMTYTDRIAEVAQESGKIAADARLHALASGSMERSAKLDTIFAPEVSSIIGTIRSVGISAGVPIKINAALPALMPKSQKDIHAVAFVIESSGSFATMMQVLALFETLPIPSSIEVVDLSQSSQSVPNARVARPWNMSIKLRVLTTAPVS